MQLTPAFVLALALVFKASSVSALPVATLATFDARDIAPYEGLETRFYDDVELDVRQFEAEHDLDARDLYDFELDFERREPGKLPIGLLKKIPKKLPKVHKTDHPKPHVNTPHRAPAPNRQQQAQQKAKDDAAEAAKEAAALSGMGDNDSQLSQRDLYDLYESFERREPMKIPTKKTLPKLHKSIAKPHVHAPQHHAPAHNQAEQRAKSEAAEQAKEAAELSGMGDNDAKLSQ